jgi:catechol 2,3-dioxygenase
MPTRADLGRWLRHWLELGYPLPGQGDHLVSEALYLSDPDGNGIEIYQDRPRDQWVRVNGQIQMATDPVDIRGLLSEGDRAGKPWTGLPAGTKLGHMHLQVGDIDLAEAFYHRVLGFDIVVRMPSALFISAGGYHHHIGMNIWHSTDAPAAPEGTAGLRFFTVVFPSEEARQAVVSRIEAASIPYTRSGDSIVVQDPWNTTILLVVGSTTDAGRASALTTAYIDTNKSR